MSRQEHIDKSVSRGDVTSTDDQQSETSLGSYEILPNDDSCTTLTDGFASGNAEGARAPPPSSSSLGPPSSSIGRKSNPLQYRIGASSSAETPDEFQEAVSDDESTLKSLSEAKNSSIQPPNDFADLKAKAAEV